VEGGEVLCVGVDPAPELAEYLGVPVKTIYEWRQTGRRPV
jgi:hypothetical protein